MIHQFTPLSDLKTCRFDFTGDLDCLIVPIEDEEYKACINPKMWCTSDEDSYKKGLGNTRGDPDKIERIGRLGECACSKVFEAEVDFRFIKGGDKGLDFTLASGLTVDVKTSKLSTAQHRQRNYITGITTKGQKKPLIADIYVGAFCVMEDREDFKAIIMLVGWMNRKQVENYGLWDPPTDSRHKNYEMPFSMQLPILDLVMGNKKWRMA